jgi:hypothetical protein
MVFKVDHSPYVGGSQGETVFCSECQDQPSYLYTFFNCLCFHLEFSSSTLELGALVFVAYTLLSRWVQA